MHSNFQSDKSAMSWNSLTLPTPALVMDGPTVLRNIQRMAAYTSQHQLPIRPHTKTHKSRAISRLQLDAGAVGLTVAKVGEAETLMSETDNLLLAYPAVDPARCQGIARIAQSKNIAVAVDSSTAVESLAAAAAAAKSTIGLLVDLNVGMNRTGLDSAQDTLGLAQQIDSTPGLKLAGLFCYPGHIWLPVDQQATALENVNRKLSDAIALWKQHGLEAQIVSGGSTPTAYQSHLVPAYTEIRPGTYIFNDCNTFRGGFCALEDCAARLVCTVVSTAVKNQVVIDGGTKTFTSDICIPARESGHGYIIEYPEAKITALSEEHGQVDVSKCAKFPKINERVTVIPNHICPCVNLQDRFWWREEDVSLREIRVDARGRLS